MTYQQIYENIAMDFPEYLETTLKIDVNRIYHDFCYKTGLPRKSYNLSLTTATSYTLETDVNRVYEIKVLDSDSKMIDDISYTIDNGTIYFYDTFGEELTELPDTVATVTIYYHGAPALLDNFLTLPVESLESPDIPVQFHSALVEGVEAKYYRRTKDFQNALMAKQAYEESIRDGKKWCNANGTSRHSVETEPIYNANWVNTNLTT